MKLICLIFVALCVYAQAAVLEDARSGKEYKIHTGPTGCSVKQTSPFPENPKGDSQLAAALAQVENVLDRSLIGDAIQNVLESLRPIIVNGNDVLPPLDPFNVPQLGPIVYTTLGTRITGELQDFRLDGLSWYIVNHVNVNTLQLRLGVKITVPWLTFTGHYDAAAYIAFLSHKAGGFYRIFLNRLEVSVDTRLGASIFGGRLYLRELDINIAIQDITISIQGVTGSNLLNGIINQALQSAAQNLLQNELETVSKLLSEQLFEAINEFLGNFTINDILG